MQYELIAEYDYVYDGELVSDEWLEGEFEEGLNEGDPVELFGLLYPAGTTLRDIDYPVFREMYLDWLEDQIIAGYVQELRRH